MIKRLLAVVLTSSILTNCANNDTFSGESYSSKEIKQVRTVSYGTLTSVKPVKIQVDNNNNVIGAIGGAVLGGFLGNTIGGGTGRNLATASGALLGGMAGQSVQGAINKYDGVELEIHKDNGKTIVVIQKQPANRYMLGQRVMITSDGNQVTVSPR